MSNVCLMQQNVFSGQCQTIRAYKHFYESALKIKTEEKLLFRPWLYFLPWPCFMWVFADAGLRILAWPFRFISVGRMKVQQMNFLLHPTEWSTFDFFPDFHTNFGFRLLVKYLIKKITVRDRRLNDAHTESVYTICCFVVSKKSLVCQNIPEILNLFILHEREDKSIFLNGLRVQTYKNTQRTLLLSH